MQCSAGLFGRSSGAFSTWDWREVMISWPQFLLKTEVTNTTTHWSRDLFGTTEQLPPVPKAKVVKIKSSHCLWNFFCQEIWILCPLAVAAAAGASWLACCQRLGGGAPNTTCCTKRIGCLKHVFSIFGCFRKWWYPQIIHFNMDFHYKSSILGYPYFWKRPFLPPKSILMVSVLLLLFFFWGGGGC